MILGTICTIAHIFVYKNDKIVVNATSNDNITTSNNNGGLSQFMNVNQSPSNTISNMMVDNNLNQMTQNPVVNEMVSPQVAPVSEINPTPQVAPMEESQPATMPMNNVNINQNKYCPTCGSSCDVDSAFCSNCGNKL